MKNFSQQNIYKSFVLLSEWIKEQGFNNWAKQIFKLSYISVLYYKMQYVHPNTAGFLFILGKLA